MTNPKKNSDPDVAVITVSEAYFNALIDAVTHLPYRQVQPLFEHLGREIQQFNPEPTKIIH